MSGNASTEMSSASERLAVSSEVVAPPNGPGHEPPLRLGSAQKQDRIATPRARDAFALSVRGSPECGGLRHVRTYRWPARRSLGARERPGSVSPSGVAPTPRGFVCLLHARRAGDTPGVIAGSRCTRLVGILGWPVEHSLSPAMQNAAFAARGLDWAYVALPTPPEHLAEAVRGLAALGFAGANVTSPHKLAVVRLCEADDPSVNTLVVRADRVEGRSTDAAILRDLVAERPVVLGDGGGATAFVHALPHARRFSRRGDWPPDVADADLVVNATSARDDVLAVIGPGQVLVDLPYPETATATAARAAGADRRVRPRGARRPGGGVLRALDRPHRRRSSDAGRTRLALVETVGVELPHGPGP